MNGIVAPDVAARAAVRNPLAPPADEATRRGREALLLDAWREIREVREQLHEVRRQLHETQIQRDDVTRDRDAYRELAQEFIHALADLTTRHKRQTARYHALLDERRDERQQRDGDRAA